MSVRTNFGTFCDLVPSEQSETLKSKSRVGVLALVLPPVLDEMKGERKERRLATKAFLHCIWGAIVAFLAAGPVYPIMRLAQRQARVTSAQPVARAQAWQRYHP
jgi:hypothetical protein